VSRPYFSQHSCFRFVLCLLFSLFSPSEIRYRYLAPAKEESKFRSPVHLLSTARDTGHSTAAFLSAPAFASVELELVHFVKEVMAPSTEPVEEQGTVAESLIDDITIKTVAVVFGEHRSQNPFLELRSRFCSFMFDIVRHEKKRSSKSRLWHLILSCRSCQVSICPQLAADEPPLAV
jgi:hypothetical protein